MARACTDTRSAITEYDFMNSSFCFHWLSLQCFLIGYTVVPPYPRVIRSETYWGYVKLQIVPNANIK
jgi:hypothetical protein